MCAAVSDAPASAPEALSAGVLAASDKSSAAAGSRSAGQPATSTSRASAPSGAVVRSSATALASPSPAQAGLNDGRSAARAADTTVSTDNRDAINELVDFMASQVGAGNMSVALMSNLATKMSAALWPRPPLPLAGMRERGLHRWSEKQPWRQYMPPLYEFTMLKRTRGINCDRVHDATHVAILPHEWFAALGRNSVLTDLLLTGGTSNLINGWNEASKWQGPWFKNLTASAVDRGRCVPIGTHGDDAGAHGSEKVTVVTWGSVAIRGGTLDSRLVFSMLKESEAPVTGLDRLMEILAWSLNALCDGVYPGFDQDGRRFGPDHHPSRAALAGHTLVEGRLCGVWSEMRGDWKFF